jgi:hypothetical protein
MVLFPEDGSDAADTLGHGTAVTAAIQEKAPDADYTALKLFGNTLRTSSSRLLQAIEWTVENRFNLVNLSLGAPNLDLREAMEALVERARMAGTILVAARQVGEQPVLPGMLAGVISADVDWNLPRHGYRTDPERTSCFFASGFPRSIPGVPPARNLSGISFAVANLTGIIARALEKAPDRSLDTIRARMAAEAQRLAGCS